MKKALHIIASAAVAIAALTSCAKEQFKENAIPAGEKIEVSLSGQIGDFTPADATKATAESVVRVTWGSGDKVYVYDGSNASIGTLTVTPDNNNASYAMLSGTITASAVSPAPSKLTLVYVKGADTAPAISGGKISIDLSSQNQTEVPFVLYTTVDYNAAALTKTNEYTSFSFATSVMTVNCTGLQTGASGAVAAIDRAEIDGVSTACELTIDRSGVTAVAGTTPGKITRRGTSVFQQSDSRGSFRLALAADPTAPAARNILVFQGSNVSGAPFSSVALAASKSYNTVYQMGEYAQGPPSGALSAMFTVSDDNGATKKQIYFSKGNLWYGKLEGAETSTFNFEANQWESSPAADGSWEESHISHFFWSKSAEEVIKKTFDTQQEISINDKFFTNETPTTASETFTVNVDGNEKKGWRTLSTNEWQYLFDNHVNKWAKVNGVYGYVIAPDGFSGTLSDLYTDAAALAADNLVFLPAAGARVESEAMVVGNSGFYWTSSACTDEDGVENAYNVQFDGEELEQDANFSRFYGLCIRLVTESSGDYIPAVKVSGVTITKVETTIKVGVKDTLVANVAPANALNKQISSWSSSNPSVATVDENGVVTGVAKGSAVITATTAEGNFTAVCLVKVRPAPPIGALSGEFTVDNNGTPDNMDDDIKIYFSQGNLWYGKVGDATETTFNFEANQWKSSPAVEGSWDNSHISHFFWSKDARVAYSADYNTANSTYGITPNENDVFFTNETKTTAKDDFTVNVGGAERTGWRTLSTSEWQYLLDNHTKKWIRVNGVYGYAIAPDGFSGNIADSYADDAALAVDNLVFLPVAGYRYNDLVAEFGKIQGSGVYWSSIANGTNADDIGFNIAKIPTTDSTNRHYGCSVRLVTECQ